MMSDLAFKEWVSRARAVTVKAELERRGLWSRALLGDAGVPCPGCGGRDRFAVNLRKNVWLCRASNKGGDAIALAQHIDGSSFMAAVQTILGEHGAVSKDLNVQRKSLKKEQADTAARFRERERSAAYMLWTAAYPIGGTPAEDYLKRRGVEAPVEARLRFHPKVPLWDRPLNLGGRIIHQGPALLAAIEGPDGRFSGVQRLWIDLSQPKGKALIVHPDTGEILPARKTRGSIKGGTILLVRGGIDAGFPSDRPPPQRLFLGEGIETTLSVYSALKAINSPLLIGAEFRSSVDLGNLAGKAEGRVKHPTLIKPDKNGRLQSVYVPNNMPKVDPDVPMIRLNETIEELWLLGDGDSEPFLTQMALERAAKRFSRIMPNLTIRLWLATPGTDFNDLLLQEEPT